MVIHQHASRQPVPFCNEHNAKPSTDSGLVEAPAKFSQAKAAMPVRLAEMPPYGLAALS